MKIGVFDSGIGGQAVADQLQLDFPSATIVTVNDQANLPYGDKTVDQLRQLTDTAIQPLLGLDVIVIACNSATTAAIDWLRSTYPSQKFIGIEPMIKPAAALSSSRTVGVCATPATLASHNYQQLKLRHARDLTVTEPDCSNWAEMIENDTVNRADIRRVVDSMLLKGVDVIVLGCTHYHWIKDLIAHHAGPSVSILEPSEAIGRRVASLLAD